jgi:multiple antibiotic resistance protein
VKELSLVLEFIPLGFSALLPVINPLGSAVIFLGLVPYADHATVKVLARKIAFNTIWFLLVVQITGAYILRFFGISLPVVQVAGGLVLATMGWSLLNKQDPEGSAATPVAAAPESLQSKLFYPLTFPVTAGPGCIVVALTLSAHASKPSLLDSALAHVGLLIATVLIGIVIYFSYAYADAMTAKLSTSMTHGILRVISFILLCIGGEIMWNGIQNLLKTLP